MQTFFSDFILVYLVPRNEGLRACITLRDVTLNVDITLVAVGYSFGFSLSYRDLVELLRDRAMTVHHATVMRWIHHYGLSLRSYGVGSKQFTLKVGKLTRPIFELKAA